MSLSFFRFGLLVQLIALVCRNIGHRSALAQLQCADVSDNPPAIRRLDLPRVVGHVAKSVGDHIKKVTERGMPQAIIMRGRRLAEPALRNHPTSITEWPVANRAIDIEALLPTSKISRGDLHRELADKALQSRSDARSPLAGRRARRSRRCIRHRLPKFSDLASIELDVVAQFAARDCAFHKRPRRTTV